MLVEYLLVFITLYYLLSMSGDAEIFVTTYKNYLYYEVTS